MEAILATSGPKIPRQSPHSYALYNAAHSLLAEVCAGIFEYELPQSSPGAFVGRSTGPNVSQFFLPLHLSSGELRTYA